MHMFYILSVIKFFNEIFIVELERFPLFWFLHTTAPKKFVE